MGQCGKHRRRCKHSELKSDPVQGYYYDTETGFYYLNSRYYDPEICRFINADGYVSTGQELSRHNMFAYCLNNPINMLDSMGSFPEWLMAIGAAVATVAVITAVTVCTGGAAAPVLVGAAVGFVSGTAVDAGFQYVTTGEIQWDQAVISGASGMAAGAFGGTALGVGGQVLANGGIGLAETAIHDFSTGEFSSLGEYAYNIGSSALVGAIGGPGAQKVSTAKPPKVTRYTQNPSYYIFSDSLNARAATKAVFRGSAKGAGVDIAHKFVRALSRNIFSLF